MTRGVIQAERFSALMDASISRAITNTTTRAGYGEETQTAENDALLHKIVYDYDQQGKQIGYSIFDGSGKLIGHAGTLSANSSPKPREKSGPR